MRIRNLALGVICAISPASASAQPAGLLRVGAAAVVRGHVEALSPMPQSVGRVMGSGQPIYLNDRITTDAQGSLQILLLDETAFTVGPNSSMVIDNFVYNPENGAGDVAASLTKGIFRFITGKIAKKQPGNVKIKLPVGTIGIFGTMVGVRIDEPTGVADVALLGPAPGNNAGERPGRITVSGIDGAMVNITRAGYGTTLKPNAGPTNPTAVPPAKLKELSDSLRQVPQAQTGAAAQTNSIPPTEAAATQQAGQATAAAGPTSASIQSSQSVAQALGNVTNIAAQQTTATPLVADGISSFADIRTVSAGTGSFNAAGVFNGTAPCAGGLANCTGNWSMAADINFAAKTLTVSGGIVTANISGAPVSLAPTVLAYSALSGLASDLHFDSSDLRGSYFFTIRNQGGTAAKTIVGTVFYGDGVNSGEGAALTATRP